MLFEALASFSHTEFSSSRMSNLQNEGRRHGCRNHLLNTNFGWSFRQFLPCVQLSLALIQGAPTKGQGLNSDAFNFSQLLNTLL